MVTQSLRSLVSKFASLHLYTISKPFPAYSFKICRSVSSTPTVISNDTKEDGKYKEGFSEVSYLDTVSNEAKKIFTLKFANKREWNRKRTAEVMKQFQLREGDTGSAAVQVGVLTVRIKYLTEHMIRNKKDKSCLRRLLHLVHKRRKLLIYLRKKDFCQYHELLKQLKIRPIPENKYAYVKTAN